MIHQLTDLPYALDASKMTAALARNARLRDVGTRNLIAAALHAGAVRLIAQSISFIYGEGPKPHLEADPLQGILSLERQATGAPLEGLVLRYGLIYGPGTGFDAAIAPGSVHVDAAAKAAELAVTRGERGIYNVTESDGATSSDKAIKAFGWDAGWRPGSAA